MIGALVSCAMAFAATVAFAVLFSTPRKEWVTCGISGLICWIIAEIIKYFGGHYILANTVAVFVLNVLSRYLAVIRKHPGTVYLLTGIFPLVPGMGIYYTIYYLIMEQKAQAFESGMFTLGTTVSIVLGIMFSFFIPQSFFNRINVQRIEDISDKQE